MKNVFAQLIFGLFASFLLLENAISASNNVTTNAEQARAALSALVSKLNKISEKNAVSTVGEMEQILGMALPKEVCEERAPGENYSDCSYFSLHDESEVIETIEFKPEPNRNSSLWYDKFNIIFNSKSYCVSPADLESAFQITPIFHPPIQYSSEEDKRTSIQKYGALREYFFPQPETKNIDAFNVTEKNGCAHRVYFSYYQSNRVLDEILSKEFDRDYPLPKLKKIPYQHKLALRTIQRTSFAGMPLPRAKVKKLFTGKSECEHDPKFNQTTCTSSHVNDKAKFYFSKYDVTQDPQGNYLYEHFTWQVNNNQHCIQSRNLEKFFKKDISHSRIRIIYEPGIPEDNSLLPYFNDYEIILKKSPPYENYLVVQQKNHCVIEIKLFKRFEKRT